MPCSRGCCETQREHWLSVGISSTAMPSRSGPRVARENEREAQLSKDLHAYRELRKNGTQPHHIDGCHDLAQRAGSKVEIEAGVPLRTKKQREQLEAVMDL